MLDRYESDKRKEKALPTKELAERIKYAQLNSDAFTGQVMAEWQQMHNDYMKAKKVQGVAEGTIYEIVLSLINFEWLIGKFNSKQIIKSVIDQFIQSLGYGVKSV